MSRILDKINSTNLRKGTEVYKIQYPWAVEIADKQVSVYWPPTEIDVNKDIQDMRINMTLPETHGVITNLRLFTLYEMEAGIGYWGGRVIKRFPHASDIQRMAQVFAYTESGIHAPFYNELNKALNLDSDEFYTDYVKDEGLKARMDFIGSAIGHENDLISVGTFSMVEGAILYSSFAFLKHFQAQSKNKLKNVVSGINFSHRDEDLHAIGGSLLFRELLKESKLTERETTKIYEELYESARKILQHEKYIIKMTFSEGEISGINEESLEQFVKSRLNLCLQNLGLEPIFDEGENPIKKWFYEGVNAVQLGDFFNGTNNTYNNNCVRTKFKFNKTYEFPAQEVKDV